jgi:predicted transcriptional regulator
MDYKETTPVPNALFDCHLPQLPPSSLVVLLVIIRGTYGWKNKRTGKRKERDRITSKQFMKKTGLSKRSVSTAIQHLLDLRLITVTDYRGNPVSQPKDRKGKSYLFYAPQPMQKVTLTSAKVLPKLVQQMNHNKTNYTKENKTKGRRGKGMEHIGSILQTP